MALLLAGACSGDVDPESPAVSTSDGGPIATGTGGLTTGSGGANGTLSTGSTGMGTTANASTQSSSATTSSGTTGGACQAGQVPCTGVCVDTLTDASNCGGCGTACGLGEQCISGSCECPAGQTCAPTGTTGSGGASSSSTTDGSMSTDGGTTMGMGGAPSTNTTGMNTSGTTGGTTGGSPSSEQYPCDGDTSGYDAVVTISGNNARSTIQNALNGLSANRTTKQSVLVQGDGSMGNNERIDIPSYTVLNVCGTITVTNAGGSGDQAPLYARNKRDIEIPNATIRGVPLYGMFFREVSNLTLGRIDMRLDGQGLAIRIDNNPGSSNNWGRSNQVTNIRLEDIYVEGAASHAVETYGVDGLVIGTVVARDVGECGVLLNATINADVGLVDAEDAATGTGYAGFRIANEAGKIGNSWPAGNIHVGEVRAIRGGRGIFCVSDSGGLTIDRLTLENNGNNSMLLENCHTVQIATISGTISGGGELRISQRTDEHTPTSNISLGNLTITGTQINESPCASNTVVCNVQGTVNVCGNTIDQCPW